MVGRKECEDSERRTGESAREGVSGFRGRCGLILEGGETMSGWGIVLIKSVAKCGLPVAFLHFV